MILFLALALAFGGGTYSTTKYYDACKEAEYKPEACKPMAKLQELNIKLTRERK